MTKPLIGNRKTEISHQKAEKATLFCQKRKISNLKSIE